VVKKYEMFMKHDVFISYSRKDSEIAERLTKVMDGMGISYFIDRDGISGGEHFINVIAEQIRTCRTFLFIGSSHSYESKWTMKEVAFAFQEKDGKDILPLLIDDTPLPHNYKFLFSDINILSLSEQDCLDKVGKALLQTLGREHRSGFSFTSFIESWQKELKDSDEEYTLNLYFERFGQDRNIDLYKTRFYQECLSDIVIPFETVHPEAPWATNYDWNLLKRLIIASNTGEQCQVCGYSFGLTKSWELNPQNAPHIIMTINYLDGKWINKNLHEMNESEIEKLQIVLMKDMVDSMLRWDIPEQRKHIEADMSEAIGRFLEEVGRITKSVFYERTKDYETIGPFHEDRARVYTNHGIGFIEPNGKLVTPVKWEDACDFSEGLACVAEQGTGEYGYIDKDGKIVIAFQWFAARPFRNGKAEVADEDGNWYLIDKNGKILNG